MLLSTLSEPHPYISFGRCIAFFVISVTMMLTLHVMECLMHVVRLHWVEWMGKFYTGGGVLFQPHSNIVIETFWSFLTLLIFLFLSLSIIDLKWNKGDGTYRIVNILNPSLIVFSLKKIFILSTYFYSYQFLAKNLGYNYFIFRSKSSDILMSNVELKLVPILGWITRLNCEININS